MVEKIIKLNESVAGTSEYNKYYMYCSTKTKIVDTSSTIRNFWVRYLSQLRRFIMPRASLWIHPCLSIRMCWRAIRTSIPLTIHH